MNEAAPIPPPNAPPAAPGPRSFWRHVAGSLRGEEHDYTSLPLPTAILLLAVPMVLEMGLESLFALVDIFWVNRIDDGWFGAVPTDGAAVAAIGQTEGMLSLVYAIAFGLGMAVTALVARRVGERNLPGAAAAGSQAIALGLTVGVLIGLPAAWFAPELLGWMSSDNAHVIEVGSGYARWSMASTVIIVLLFLQNAIFRGAGDPMLALKVLTVSNGLNLLLDPCLIFGIGPFPAMGVEGAAVATCTGRTIAVGYQFFLLTRGQGRVKLDRIVHFAAGPMWKMVRLSMGTIGQFLIGTTSWLFLTRFVNEFGEQAGAGYTTGIRILLFALLPAWGLANAAATLVGQNLGAGRPDRAERAVWLTGFYDMLFLAVVTVVMELFPELIVDAMASGDEVRGHALATLRICASGYVFYAWGMVAMQAFNGAGDTRTPTWITVWCMWCLQLPLAYTLGFHTELGPTGVFWSIPISETAFAVVSVILFRRGRWRDVKV
ncbi:MAG: MATE family efflux transporter [Planctomycetota bacterium]